MAIEAGTAARARIDRLERVWLERPGVLGWLTTTDHKRIGLLYFFTSLFFFAAGGVEALLIRSQLLVPNETLVSPGAFNQLFTMHGLTMIFLFVIPMSTGAFGNYLLPLMIGARDMAFPRMNAFSFWAFLCSGIFIYIGLFMGNAPDAGWFNYVPLAGKQFSPGVNIDFYGLGLIFNGVSTTAAAINFIVTIFKLRAPGMSINRMPLFCFAFLAVSFALLFALPPLNTALVFLELDRLAGFDFFNIGSGGAPLLWQHLFWLFGHPEVYIIILPAFGIATAIIPTFTRRRMVAFPLVALAEILVAFIGFGVWVHHMFAVGLATITMVYFAAASLIIVIPSAIQLFAWITTMVTGTPRFKTPLLWIVGFITFFIVGGLSGISFAVIPFDQQLTDTYFVVAHFHFVIFGAAVFPILGGMYYWFPKVTGRMYHEGLGQLSFWLTFFGTALTFFPMHILGLLGMPRREYTYADGLGWQVYNVIETAGSYVLAAGLLLVAANLGVSLFRGRLAGNDPWGGDTLEWSTTSPPPPYNYPVIPAVTSPYPMWDLADREADAHRLERGELTLEGGHETLGSSVLDAEPVEVLEMPAESPWPILLALMLAGAFALVLTTHYGSALVFLGLAAVVLGAWHWKEPETRMSTALTPRRGTLPNGVWAVALVIATEGAFLGCLIASYLFLATRVPEWPPPGVPEPRVLAPVILTALLVLTAVFVYAASSFARRGRAHAAWVLVFVAFLLQAEYLGAQIYFFHDDLSQFSPTGSAYASAYFTLLGAHHAHVLVGLLLDVWLLLRLLGGMTPYRATTVRIAAWYWVFVAGMGVLVNLTVISPAL